MNKEDRPFFRHAGFATGKKYVQEQEWGMIFLSNKWAATCDLQIKIVEKWRNYNFEMVDI